MREFRSLFTWTFQESSHESSSDNSRPFERNFPGTKNAISSNFRYETKFHDDKRISLAQCPKFRVKTDTTIPHTIHSIFLSCNVREIYRRFSTHSLTGVQSRTERMRITKLTTSEDFEISFIPEETKHNPFLISVVVRYQLCSKPCFSLKPGFSTGHFRSIHMLLSARVFKMVLSFSQINFSTPIFQKTWVCSTLWTFQ